MIRGSNGQEPVFIKYGLDTAFRSETVNLFRNSREEARDFSQS
ncbi:hypothetical protein C8R21_10696 [Nitrosospira multiformis]|jgi:hypothetical protein|uniref:Uncharacterized protein n=1 Tax=Nitrosospira multiformis TaxID=1231 RepID=A0A2T5IE60_9PROT|nr:hypothetical protein C8R21_10696 [Nitrosospira multiformis]